MNAGFQTQEEFLSQNFTPFTPNQRVRCKILYSCGPSWVTILSTGKLQNLHEISWFVPVYALLPQIVSIKDEKAVSRC